MTSNQLSNQIDSIVSGIESKFGKQVSKTQKALLEQMQVMLNRLDLDSDGLIKQSQTNREILARVDTYFQKALTESQYYDSLGMFVNGINSLNEANAEYYGAIIDGFSANAQYLKNIQRQAIKDIEVLFANEGLESMIKRPLVDILNQNINTGAAYNDLLKQVREFILGSDEIDGQLLRYSKQITTDTLFNYSRAYQEAISENAGLEWYLYSGGLIRDSRDFCASRAGNYYHRSEIEKWASRDWSGKRRGTTQSTIYVYVGGYNCRHQLIAVSESVVPDSVKNRIK